MGLIPVLLLIRLFTTKHVLVSDNVIIYIGSDWDIECEWADDNGPINLTGATITAQITELLDIDEVLIPAATVTPVDLTIGKFTVSLDETQTDDIPEGLMSALIVTINLGRSYKIPKIPLLGAE